MFFAKAHTGRNDFAWYLITAVLAATGYFLGQLPLLAGIFASGVLEPGVLEEFTETQNLGVLGMNKNLMLFLLLWMFIFALLGLWVGVKRLHKKKFLDILTARPRLDWSRIFFGFGFWMAAFLITEVIMYIISPENYVFQFQIGPFLILLVIVLFMLPIQTSFEEIFFRGYLMQGFGLLFKSRIGPLLLTSLMFGAMHFMNPEVKEFGLGIMMTYYIGVGLMLGIVTLMDDGLELALGVHAATNIYGSLFVTFESSAVQTDAIFRLEEVAVVGQTCGFFVVSLIFIFMCTKKYNWRNWGKIFGPIDQFQSNSIANTYENGDEI